MKPRKLDSYPPQSYPGIDRYRCERREFLRKVVLGAVSVGLCAALAGYGPALLASYQRTHSRLVGPAP